MRTCPQADKWSAQVRPDSQTLQISSSTFSPNTTRLCWVAFILLHAYCWIYFAAMACFYWGLPGTTLDVWLYFYELSLGSAYDRAIAIVLGSVAAIHFAYLVWIVCWSLKNRGWSSPSTTYSSLQAYGHHSAKSQWPAAFTVLFS